MKRFICLTALALIALLSANIVMAAPILAIVDDTDQGIIDVFYTPDPADELAEFTQIRVTVTCNEELTCIQDPQKSILTSTDPDNTFDTFLNTVASLFGVGAASHNFSSYNPVGFGSDPVPTAKLDWTAFDTLGGDNAGIGGLPWHLGRILYEPGTAGTVEVLGFDTLGESFAARQFGIPEPTSMALAGLAMLGMVTLRRRNG